LPLNPSGEERAKVGLVEARGKEGDKVTLKWASCGTVADRRYLASRVRDGIRQVWVEGGHFI